MIPRRTVEEFLELLSLPPRDNFLFVEGQFDVRFYGRQLHLLARKAVLQTSDYLDLPKEKVEALGPIGSKTRLLALGELLNESAQAAADKVVIVVDRDLERLVPRATTWHRTLRTDHVQAEHYSSVFADFMHALTLLEGDKVDAQFIMDVEDICLTLFYVRAWMEAKGHFVALPPRGRSMSLDGRRIVFNAVAYVARLGSSIGKGNVAPDFSECAKLPKTLVGSLS